jgi:SagB-type dehydrogenase family enzyme
MERMRAQREWMKSAFGTFPMGDSDQVQGKPEPPIEKACPPDAELVALPPPDTSVLTQPELRACMASRRSRRHWSHTYMSKEELSFLLWATQGVEEVVGDGYATMRTVPSGGARHAFETYLIVNRVDGLLPAVYRYRPVGHELVFQFGSATLLDHLNAAVFGQRFVNDASVVFIWTCVPYRGEWRYGPAAHKLMLIDAGHVCQNLYLACEAIGAGTCAVAAYDQDALDRLLQLDTHEEFSIYLAPVGKRPE